MIATFALIYIYTYYYSESKYADIHNYFNDSVFIHKLLLSDPVSFFKILTGINYNEIEAAELLSNGNTGYWYKAFNHRLFNDNRTIIRFNVLFNFFTFRTFIANNIFMSFLAFSGFFAFYKSFQKFIKQKKLFLFLSFLLPNTLFWTSGNLKESLVLFAFGFFIYFSFKLIQKEFSIKNILLFLLFSFLMTKIKYYFIVALIPPLIFYAWVKLWEEKKVLLKFIVVHFVLLFLSLSSHYFTPYNFYTTLAMKHNDFVSHSIERGANTLIEAEHYEFTPASFVKEIPKSIYNVVFRPHIFEVNNKLMLLNALENLFIILLFILPFFFFKRGKKDIPLILFLSSLLFTLFFIIGFTVPVLGAIVRYKAPVMLFLIVLFMIFIDFDKIITKVKKTNSFFNLHNS